MDDILFCQREPFQDTDLRTITTQLKQSGLTIASEKIQRQDPWLYLGWKISDTTVRPQKVEIQSEFKTLTDVQKFMSDVQWVRKVVGITNEDLEPLMSLLQDTNAAKPVSLTSQQKAAISTIGTKIVNSCSFRRLENVPLVLWCLDHTNHPFAIIGQWQRKKGEKVDGQSNATAVDDWIIIEWIFLSIQPKFSIQTHIEALAELIKRGRKRIIELDGVEPEQISVPIAKDQLEWCLANSWPLQESLIAYTGQITNVYPSGRLWQVVSHMKWYQVPKISLTPVNGRTVFTDAGKAKKKAACVWEEDGQWKHHLINGSTEDSLQTLELAAVVWAFSKWNSEPLNVVTDSLYVAGVIARIEDALLRTAKKQRLLSLFLQLKQILSFRVDPYCIIHIKSHQLKQGLGEGNDKADALVSPVQFSPAISIFEQARISHEMFHQNSKSLMRQFKLTSNEAKGIVRACPQCSHHGPGLGLGVNPCGLKALQMWQMDVTHVSQFGRLKYVHVSVDTYSKMIWATPLTGETAKHVCKHLTAAFAVMGIPEQIKTDNGPAYVSGTL